MSEPIGRFVVGTGRCGSTLLSTMLANNPSVLDVSEFFVGLDWEKRLQDAPMSGSDFVRLLEAPHPFVGPALRAGFDLPEVTYPFDKPGARRERGDDLPWLLTCTLPRMTSDPDLLLEEIRSFCAPFGSAPPARHAERLFGWLASELGRDVWVERSGASISYLGDILRAFPGARVVHIHREGEASALSMRAHPVFRIGAMLTYGIPIGEGGTTEQLARLGANADHVEKLLASFPPAHYFGRWWSSQLLAGFGSLHAIDPSRYAEVSYEDLLACGDQTLAGICESLDVPNPSGSWRQAARACVGAPSVDRFTELSRDEQEELRWACLPGNRLLARAR